MSLPGTPQGEVSHLEPSGPVPMETSQVNEPLELHSEPYQERFIPFFICFTIVQ